MTVDKAQIGKLAALARIGVSDDIAGDVAGKISDILDMVEQMRAVDTADIAPMANPLDARQRLRADQVTEPDLRERYQAIAPAAERGLYLVPRVID